MCFSIVDYHSKNLATYFPTIILQATSEAMFSQVLEAIDFPTSFPRERKSQGRYEKQRKILRVEDSL